MFDVNRQGQDSFGPGRGYGRGMNGRMGGRGFGKFSYSLLSLYSRMSSLALPKKMFYFICIKF